MPFVGGSRYITLPRAIVCFNIFNDDDFFNWCIVASFYEISTQIIQHLTHMEANVINVDCRNINFTFLDFLMNLNSIKKFENQNDGIIIDILFLDHII